MALSLKKVDLMCLIIVIVVPVLCFTLVANLGVKQRGKNRQENELLSKRLKDLKLADTNLERLKTTVNDTKGRLMSLNDRIPEEAKIGEFLTQIDVLMKERDIALTSVQPLSGVKEKLFTRIPIRLIFKGPFVKIYHLIHDLETMDRTVRIEKIRIAKSNIEKECRVDLTASVFER